MGLAMLALNICSNRSEIDFPKRMSQRLTLAGVRKWHSFEWLKLGMQHRVLLLDEIDKMEISTVSKSVSIYTHHLLESALEAHSNGHPLRSPASPFVA